MAYITCVYCGRSNRVASCEHIIPESLGGRLTTDHVCVECNSNVGAKVDAPFSDSLFMRLTRISFMDFLPKAAIPDFAIDAELRSKGHEDSYPGRLRFSYRGLQFEPSFGKRTKGNKTIYFMPDTAEGRKHFARLKHSPTANIQNAEWIDLPPAPDNLTIAEELALPYPQMVMKLFLGFLASEGFGSLALQNTFDPARSFLLGDRPDLFDEGFDIRTGTRNAPLEALSEVGHEIGFLHEDGYDLFSVTLFDCLQFQMIVGDKLRVIPQVYRRFSLGRKRTSFHVSLFRIIEPKVQRS